MTAYISKKATSIHNHPIQQQPHLLIEDHRPLLQVFPSAQVGPAVQPKHKKRPCRYGLFSVFAAFNVLNAGWLMFF
jgi:hypothetical protein